MSLGMEDFKKRMKRVRESEAKHNAQKRKNIKEHLDANRKRN